MANTLDDISIDHFSNSKWANEVDAALRSVAAGGYTNQIQTFLKGIDRYQRNILPTNAEHSGLTFITRPRLNLQSSSLRQDRVFAPLDGDPATVVNSMQFMIRCLLDTKFAYQMVGKNIRSPLVDYENPFFTPLCNALTGISGYPDPIIQTLTTDPGFHSEDQTFAIGHDDLNKTYDLNLSFKDIQHGPICAMFLYWIRYIHNVTKGTMLAYSDDIDNQRLNYTVSIYRFVMDPSRRYITRFSKATGCFPKSVPIGAMFNFSEGELFISSAGKFSIPFVANKIEYNDYAIFADFNRLAERYWPDINRKDAKGNLTHAVETGDYIDLRSIDGTESADKLTFDARGGFLVHSKPVWIKEIGEVEFYNRVKQGRLIKSGDDNYSGKPYIDTSQGRPRLSFRVSPNEVRI